VTLPFHYDPSFRTPGWFMTRIKALSVLQTMELVQERHGSETVARLMAAITPEARHGIYETSLLPTDWVEVRHVVETVVAYDNLLGTANGQAAQVLVRELAEAQITGVYRLLFAFTSPRTLFEKSARLWSRYYDQGESISAFQGASSATQRILGCPDLPLHHEWLMLPFTEVVLSHAGAKEITTRHTQCVATGADSCISEFHWK
jgi:hypothetical protein